MTYYNLTFLDNSTGIVDLAIGVNNGSNNWLFSLLLLIIWIMIIMVFSNQNIKHVILGSSFVVSLLAGLFFGIGLVPAWIITFPVIMMLLGIILVVWN